MSYHITRLTICNLFQFFIKNLTFLPGVNVLIGPNGAGKTNISNCIKFALIGVLPTTKTSCKNRLTNENSTVEMCFDISDTNYCIYRSLDDGKSILKRNDATLVEGHNKVTEAICSILNVKEKSLKDHIFIEQGKIRFFVESSTSERVAWMQRILELDRLQKLWTSIGTMLDAYSSSISMSLAQCKTAVEQYEILQKKKEELENQDDLSLSIETIEHTLDIIKQNEYLMSTLKDKIQRLKNIAQDIRDIESQLIKLKKYEELQEKRNELVALLSVLDQIGEFKNIVHNFYNSRPRIPRKPETAPEKIREKVSRLTAEIEILEFSISRIEDLCCFVCDQPLDSAAVIRIKNKLNNKVDEIKNAKDKLTQLEMQQKKYTSVKKERERLRFQVKSAISSLKTLKNKIQSFPTDYSDVSVIKTILQRLDEVQILKGKLEKLYEVKAVYQREVESIEAKLAQNKVTFTKDDLEAKLSIKKEIQKISTQLNSLQSMTQMYQELHDKKRKLDVVSRVRELLKPQSLISRVMEDFVTTINYHLNNTLKDFDANFTAELNSDFKYIVQYDGKIISEKELSYGEQLMLSLSQHLAINEFFGMNIVLLDEPTLGLDNYHTRMLVDVLNNYKTKDKNKQIFCCTHDKTLADCADNVIEVNATTG